MTSARTRPRPRGRHLTPYMHAPAKRTRERGAGSRPSRRSAEPVREHVEVEVREALYGRRSGAVEKL